MVFYFKTSAPAPLQNIGESPPSSLPGGGKNPPELKQPFFSAISCNFYPKTTKKDAVISQNHSVFGTPDQTLTGGLPLRRRSLYTTELQGPVSPAPHPVRVPFHFSVFSPVCQRKPSQTALPRGKDFMSLSRGLHMPLGAWMAETSQLRRLTCTARRCRRR